jgi:tripartite-type tricarboxylate transporter receptor subunit TctC
MLAGHPSVPVKTIKDLISLAKAQPGKLNYGSSGTGSINHLKGELLQVMAGIRLEHVPFKGVGPAITAVMGGEIEFVFASTTALGQHVKGGKLRGIGVTGTKRFSLLPEVPTIAESGVTGYNVTGWYALFAPAGMPADIARRLHAETVRALNNQDAKGKLEITGNEPVASSPAEFAEFLRAEIDKWATVIKSSGIKKIE